MTFTVKGNESKSSTLCLIFSKRALTLHFYLLAVNSQAAGFVYFLIVIDLLLYTKN